jgi:tRNA (cmo5U34)-methyltransferase
MKLRKSKDKDVVFKGEKAKEYSQFQKAVPHHKRFYMKVGQLVGDEVKDGLQKKKGGVVVCDVGVGIGLSLSNVWNQPNIQDKISRLFAVDISAEMIEQAREQFDDPKIIFINQNILDFLDNPGIVFDGFYSACTIHNYSHNVQEEIYRRIFKSLRRDGFFVNGDLFSYTDPKIHKRIFEWYISMCNKHLTSPQREDWIEHYHADQKNYFTLEQGVYLLGEIGFKVKVMFREKLETVILAKKP